MKTKKQMRRLRKVRQGGKHKGFHGTNKFNLSSYHGGGASPFRLK